MSNGSNEKKKTVKNAIFCATPFHVLGAIAISRDQASETDIYITNQFGDSRRLAGILKEENRFHDVIYIDAQATRIEVIPSTGIKKLWTNSHSLLQYIRNCACIRKTVNRYLHTEYDYERIFVASNSMAGRYAILYYIKTKKHFQLWQYDDGMGSYVNSIAERLPLYDRFFRIVFFGKRAVSLKKRRIMFSPKLYMELNPQHEKVYAMPKLTEKETVLIHRLYPEVESFQSLSKVIMIDTLNEGYTLNGWKEYTTLRERIEDYVGVENIVYKKHPRDREINDREKEMASIPFEVLCMGQDMSEKILITSVSSAVYTPKLVFDQEPALIILCRCLEDGMTGDKSYEHIEVVRKLYRDSSRVEMPENSKEVFLALDRHLGREKVKNE